MAIHPEEREQLAKFPSNSHKAREEKKEAKKVEKIISGKVVQRKKSLGKRLMETFVGDDISNVSFYVIHDVLIPAAKSTLSEMVQGGIELMLFGERKGSRTSRERGRSYVSYDKQRYNQRDERRDVSPRNRARHNFDEVILDSRGEAEEVLSHLVDLTIDYGQASVSDLYDLVGITGSFTDNKYGWTDLSSASASIARGGGYVLHLPKTVLLD
jgi:hypothetical protein